MTESINLRDVLAKANPFPLVAQTKTVYETIEEALKVLDTPPSTVSNEENSYKYLARLDDLLDLAPFSGVRKPSIYDVDEALRIITESDDPLEKLAYLESQLNILWDKSKAQMQSSKKCLTLLDTFLEGLADGKFQDRWAEIKNEEFAEIINRRRARDRQFNLT